jgi:hypothetical protein
MRRKPGPSRVVGLRGAPPRATAEESSDRHGGQRHDDRKAPESAPSPLGPSVPEEPSSHAILPCAWRDCVGSRRADRATRREPTSCTAEARGHAGIVPDDANISACPRSCGAPNCASLRGTLPRVNASMRAKHAESAAKQAVAQDSAIRAD